MCNGQDWKGHLLHNSRFVRSVFEEEAGDEIQYLGFAQKARLQLEHETAEVEEDSTVEKFGRASL